MAKNWNLIWTHILMIEAWKKVSKDCAILAENVQYPNSAWQVPAPLQILSSTIAPRDVNGDPIPANPWGIPLLGYGYETKIVSMGMDMGQNIHPLGKRVWVWETIIRSRLPMGILYVYVCYVCMNELRPSRPPSPAWQRTRPQVLAQQGNTTRQLAD
jgi:hypothetical protein